MSASVGRINGLSKKLALANKLESLKSDLVNLQTLSDSDLYSEYVQSEGMGLDIATRPADFNKYIDNVANGITFADNILESATEVNQILNNLYNLAAQYHSGDVLTADQKTNYENEMSALMARFTEIEDNSYFNEHKLFGASTFSVKYNPKGDSVTFPAIKVNVTDGVMDPSGITVAKITTGTPSVVQQWIDNFKNALATSVAKRSTLVSLRKSLEGQQKATVDGMASYKQRRTAEIGQSIDDITRAMDVIKIFYDI